MRIPEGFGDDRLVETIAMPEPLLRRELRELRRDARIEQDLVFTTLEFFARSLHIAEGPKLFHIDNYTEFERTKVLAVPLGHVGIHLNTMFVAVNTETSHPESNDERWLRATAYKFDAGAKQICQYPVQTAVIGKHDIFWKHEPDFGPYIRETEGLVTLHCWDGMRLSLPAGSFDKISIEAIRQRDMARELAGVLGSLSLADQKNFSLFPSKL
jgi:hypothetical protein